MGCVSSKNLNSGIIVMYNGSIIELKGQEYNYSRLLELVSQRTEKKSQVLSISNSGNAFRIKDENDLNSLKVAKRMAGRILLMVAPEDLSDIFNLSLVKDKKLDKGFETINIKCQSMLKIIAAFDKNFNRFVLSLSVLFVRSCNITTTMTSLIVILTPYLQEITSDPPYIKIPEQMKSLMPQKLREILTLWEKVLSNLEKIEEHLHTLDNNLTFLLGGRTDKRLEIIKGNSVLNLQAYKIAENNVKVHKSLERVKDIESKIAYFKDSVIQSINIHSDRRVQIVKRITLINEKCVIESPHQISWIFGLGDYATIPSDIRFY
ncbi:hypothetical protein SteCoe_25259 [Stentor coeruleus]|uniref:Uncharacterized protein n=1 Tax=Stentor coeruleus TaxID=5963 RepID=A0A1R2BFL8_9CILI|nr:hypothetical protein SteCoe_25259 [Stentor coeruleus]